MDGNIGAFQACNAHNIMIQKLNSNELLAIEALIKAENNLLFVFGWKDLGNGEWLAPENYDNPYSSYSRVRGRAINSLKQYLFGLGGLARGMENQRE